MLTPLCDFVGLGKSIRKSSHVLPGLTRVDVTHKQTTTFNVNVICIYI